MSGFLFTPMTRFYAEDLEYMKNEVGNRKTQTGSFAGTVEDKLSQMEYRNGGKRAESKKREENLLRDKQAKRAKRRKLYMDLAQKAWYKHESERKYQESIDLHRREVSSARLRQWSLERAMGEKVELGVNPSVLSAAATEFTQGYVFFKIPSARLNAKPRTSK